MLTSLTNAIVAIFALQSIVCEELQSNIKRCPSSCICDSIERYVLCQDDKLYRVPLPLPNGTKLLGLSKNEFTSISPSTFNGMDENTTLESLVLYDNKIATIRPNSFRNTRKLRNLWLFGNRLTRLKANTFAGLTELEDLDLSRNQLSYIEDDTFTGLKKLRVLHLWGNLLKNLQPNSFAGLENLFNLTLGDNEFKKIPTDSLRNLKNLNSLEVLNLPVEKLPADAFKSLTNLEKLHIGDWPLLGDNIERSSFTGLSSLVYLSLYGCDLSRIPSFALSPLKSLKQLLLNNNPRIQSITEKDFATLHNLEELHLSKVGVHTIHESPFKMLTKLTVLDLSQNNISVLPSHLFFQLERLRMLNLSYNHLKVLSSSTFVTLSQINTIDLSNNELICDCDIKWLKALQELKIREHFTLKGKCSDPIKYKGYDIVSLPPRKFICEPPSFDETSVQITGVAGMNVYLPCSPKTGVPTPKIKWTNVKSKKEFKTLKNGSLFLKVVEKRDEGRYVCEAINKFGQAKTSVILRVQHRQENKSQSSMTTGIIVAIILLVMSLIGLCIYKRNGYNLKRFYNTLDGSDDVLKYSSKSGVKLS